jgi:hypothetical protein
VKSDVEQQSVGQKCKPSGSQQAELWEEFGEVLPDQHGFDQCARRVWAAGSVRFEVRQVMESPKSETEEKDKKKETDKDKETDNVTKPEKKDDGTKPEKKDKDTDDGTNFMEMEEKSESESGKTKSTTKSNTNDENSGDSAARLVHKCVGFKSSDANEFQKACQSETMSLVQDGGVMSGSAVCEGKDFGAEKE